MVLRDKQACDLTRMELQGWGWCSADLPLRLLISLELQSTEVASGRVQIEWIYVFS
jgi:hypothetical protein